MHFSVKGRTFFASNENSEKKSEPQMVFEPMTLYDLVEFSFGAKKHIMFYFYKKRLCKR